MLDARAIAIGVVIIVAAPSCGGRLATDDSDAGARSPNDGEVQGAVDCPAAQPAAGAACAREALACEYGADVDPACNAMTVCTNGAWYVAPTRHCGPPAPQSVCEAALGPAPVSQCSTPGALCEASGDSAYVRCACVAMGNEVRYQCLLASTDPACAYPRPHLGTRCGADGIVCDYGACFAIAGGARLRCTSGVWAEETMVSCP